MKNKIINISIKIIAIIMLLWALADNPYGYYQILRWVVFGISAYFAFSNFNDKKNIWGLIFTIIAILFNPIIPVYLNREIWSVIDIGSAIIILINVFIPKIIKRED